MFMLWVVMHEHQQVRRWQTGSVCVLSEHPKDAPVEDWWVYAFKDCPRTY